MSYTTDPPPRRFNFAPVGGRVEPSIPQNMPRVGGKRGKNYKGFIPEIHHPQYYPARNQSGMELAGNALAQFGNEVVMGTLEGAGYLIDVPGWLKPWQKGETDLSNWFSDWARTSREEINNDLAPIYDHRSNEGFQPWNGRWWAKHTGTIGSFLSILIPMTGGMKVAGAIGKGLGKGASWATRGTKLAQGAEKFATGTKMGLAMNTQAAQYVGRGLQAGAMSRHMEGLMEANGLMEQMLQEGYSEEQAAMAAAQNYRTNSVLLVVDAIQMGALFSKGISKGLARMGSRSSKKGNMFAEALFQAPGEGFEEAFQHISAEEARARTIDGEAPGGPGNLFGENFNDRWDNYMRDDDLWTATLLGAFGGLATPLAMEGIGKMGNALNSGKSPFARKQKEEDELRQRLSQDMTASQEEYLKDRDFFTTAMYFASQGRSHDMQGMLETYESQWKDDPEMSANYERAQKYLEALPEFEKLFNRAQNKRGYTRQGEWEHIKEPAGALRVREVSDQWELIQLGKAYDMSKTEFQEILNSTPELAPEHYTAYELQKRKELAEMRGDEKGTAHYQTLLEKELKTLEEAGTPVVGDPAKTLVTSQDGVTMGILSMQGAAEVRVEELKKDIRLMQTTEGQLKILRQMDKQEGERKEQMEEYLSMQLGEGVIVGNEGEQWHVKQEGDKFHFHKPGNPDIPGAATTTVSDRESELFYKTAEVTDQRKAAIANRIRNEGRETLGRHEKAMYVRYQPEIDGLVGQNKDDNSGQGFTRIEMRNWMAANGYEVLDDTAYKTELEDEWIERERSAINKSIDLAQNELVEVTDLRDALQKKANRLEGRWGKDSKEYQATMRQIQELDKEMASLSKEIAELEEAYQRVEESEILHYRRVIPKEVDSKTGEVFTPIFGSESGADSPGTPPPPTNQEDSAEDGVNKPPPPDNEQTQDYGGRPANIFFHTLAGAEVDMDGDYTQSASQIRYFNFLRNRRISGRSFGAQVIPVTNEDGTFNSNWEAFFTDTERAEKAGHNATWYQEVMVALVVNSAGYALDANGTVISDPAKIPSEGVYTTMRSTSEAVAKRGVNAADQARIPQELAAYTRARNAMRASAWAGNKVYIKLVGKTSGYRQQGEQIPIVDALKDDQGVRVGITRTGLIQGDGWVLSGIHPGSPYIFDENSGSVIVGTSRNLNPLETQSIFRILEEAQSSAHGLDDLHQSTLKLRTILRTFMYYGKDSPKNEGGDMMHVDDTFKLLKLRDFGGEKYQVLPIEELLTTRREEFEAWLQTRRRNVDDRRLWKSGASTKRNKKATSKYTQWFYNGSEWTTKEWGNYQLMILDREQGILSTFVRPYIEDSPQFVNQGAIYNYNAWKPGKVPYDSNFPIVQDPEIKPTPRRTEQFAKTGKAVVEEEFGGTALPEGLGEGPPPAKKGQTMADKAARAAAMIARMEAGQSPTPAPAKSDKTGGGVVVITGVEDVQAPPVEKGNISEDLPTNPTKDQEAAQEIDKSDPPIDGNTETFAQQRPEGDTDGVVTGIDRKIDPYRGSEYVQEDLIAAEKWFKKRFPHISFRIVHNLVKSGAWGRFTESGEVLLDANAALGTIYHEAFHVTTQLFLTRSQTKALYNEYRRKFKAKGMPNDQVEEALAELFREYVQSGTLPKELTKARTWFQRLLDTLRQLVGRKDIITVFQNINNGYYARLKPDYKNLWQSWDREIEKKFTLHDRSAEFTRQAVEAVHITFMREMSRRQDTAKFLDGSLHGEILKDVYLRVRDEFPRVAGDLLKQMEKLLQEADAQKVRSTRDEYNERVQDLKSLHENFFDAEQGPSVIELHRRHMAQMGLRIIEESEDIDENSMMADPDNDWAALQIETGQLDSATTSVRFYLSGLREFTYDIKTRMDKPQLTRLGLPKSMKFGKAFQLLAKKLGNTTSIEEQIQRIEDLVGRYPDMAQIVEDFALTDLDSRAGTGFMRRMEFFQAFAKHINNYTKDIVRRGKAPQRMQTGSTNKRRQMIKSWEVGFNSKGISKTARARFKATGQVARSFEEAVQIAKELGIPFDGILQTVKRHERQLVMDKVNHIARTVMRDVNPFAMNKENGLMNNGADFNALVGIELEYDPDYTESSHIGMKNTTIYDNVQYSWWNYMGTRINDIIQKGHENKQTTKQIRAAIVEEFNHLDTPYTGNSILLARLIDHHGLGSEPMRQSVEEGVTDYRGNIKSEYSRMTATDKFIKEMVDITKGVYHMIRPNDNALERTYTLSANPSTGRGQHYFDVEDATNGAKLNEIISKYLEDELRMLNAVRVTDPEKYRNWKNFTENMTNDDKVLKSGVLVPILSTAPKGVRTAMRRVINRKRGVNAAIAAFLKSKEGKIAIEKIRGALWQTATRRVLPALEGTGFFTSGLMLDSFDTIAREPAKEGQNSGQAKIAMFLTMNHMMNMVEQTKVFTGHPAQYKSVNDMIKRLSGAVGPKSLSPIDAATNKFLKERFGIANAESPYLGIATVRDPVSSSRYNYLDLLTNRFGKTSGEEKAALYKMMIEADAHAVIILDAYRHFNIRQANWDYKREAAYIWQMQGGWRVDKNGNSPKIIVPRSNPFSELHGLEITREMIEQEGYLLVSQKPQGFGPLADTGMISMYKLAMTPLLPEMIDGTEMADLNEKMSDGGIDIVIVESGHKLGVRTKADGNVQSLYNSDGTITSETLTSQEMPMQYFGIQVANTPSSKNTVTNGTQLQRQVESGLSHMGMPVDWIMQNLQTKAEKAKHPERQSSHKNKVSEMLEPFYITDNIPRAARVTFIKGVFAGGERSAKKAYKDTLAWSRKVDNLKSNLQGDQNLATAMMTSGFTQEEQNAFLDQIKENDTLFDTISSVENAIMNDLNSIRLSLDLPFASPEDVGQDQTRVIYDGQYDVRGLDPAKEGELLQQWSEMSEKQKRQASPVYDRIKKLRKQQADALDYTMLMLENKLGLTRTTAGYTRDPARMGQAKEFLLQEMTKRDLPVNMLEALRWFDEGTDVIVNPGQMKNILMSIATKQVLSRKKFGSGMAMVPSTFKGTKARTVAYTDPKEGTVWSADDLEFYQEEDGEIKGFEVYLPHKFKEMFGENVDISQVDPKLLEMLGFRIPTQGLSSIDFFRVKGFLPSALRDSIMVPAEIVAKTGADFDWDKLFIHMRNYRMVDGRPEVVTAIPLDKLWDARQREFALEFEPKKYRDISAKYRKELSELLFGEDVSDVEWKRIINSLRNKKDIDSQVGRIIRDMESDISEVEQGAGTGATTLTKAQILTKMSSLREDINMIRLGRDTALRALYKEIKPVFDALGSAQQQGLKYMDNLILDSHIDMMKMPGRFSELIAPVTTDPKSSVYAKLAKELIEDRQEWEKDSVKKTIKPESFSMLLDPLQMGRVGHNLVKGKQNVGVPALASTNHINATQAGLAARLDTLTSIVRIGIPHNTNEDGMILLGRQSTTGRDYFISDLINELISGYVDIGNDPFIININGGDTAAIYALMAQIGVDPKIQVALLNQPIVRKYLYKAELQGSTFLRIKRSSKLPAKSREKLRENMLKEQYAKTSGKGNSQANMDKLRDAQVLWDQSLIPFDPYDPSYEDSQEYDHALQFQALKTFINLEIAATKMREVIQSTTHNTKFAGRDPLVARMRLAQTYQTTTDITSSDNEETDDNAFKALFDNDSFLELYRDGVERITEMMQPFQFITYNEKARDAMHNIIGEILRTRENLSEEDRNRIMQLYHDEFLTHLYHVANNIEGSLDLIMSHMPNAQGQMVINTNTVPKRLAKYRRSMASERGGESKEKKPYNILVDHLVPTFKNETNYQREFKGTLDGKEVTFGKLKYTDNLSLQPGKKMDAHTTDMYTEAYRELIQIDPTLEGDLFRFLMLQNGIVSAPNNFINIIPHETFRKEMAAALEKMNNSDVNYWEQFTNSEFFINMRREPTFGSFNPDVNVNQQFIGTREFIKEKYVPGKPPRKNPWVHRIGATVLSKQLLPYEDQSNFASLHLHKGYLLGEYGAEYIDTPTPEGTPTPEVPPTSEVNKELENRKCDDTIPF